MNIKSENFVRALTLLTSHKLQFVVYLTAASCKYSGKWLKLL